MAKRPLRSRSAETLVSEFFVAGLVYSDYATTSLKRGQSVSLVKEPTNPYDRFAIRVYTAGRQRTWVGFVPRDQTNEISTFSGRITRAVIHAFEPANATHRRLLVKVYGIPMPAAEVNVIC